MPLDRHRLEALVRQHATVADKIRARAGAGVPRADIARFLGKRYQHVRNVLEGDQQSGGYVLGKADLSGVQDSGRAFEREEDPTEIDRRSGGVTWLRIRPDGSMPLSPELTAVLRAEPGRRVQARLKDGVVTVVSADTAAKRARAAVRSKVPSGSVVDEFLAERREMWGEEDE